MSDGGDFLRRLVTLLERAQIPHRVAGSFASTLHGTPGSTQDIDLVIDPSSEALFAFVAGLDPDEYERRRRAGCSSPAEPVQRGHHVHADVLEGRRADLRRRIVAAVGQQLDAETWASDPRRFGATRPEICREFGHLTRGQ